MNRLVIIGNGFDLAHGLKTNYKDFLLWYLKGCVREFEEKLEYQDLLVKVNGRYSRGKYEEIYKALTFEDFEKKCEEIDVSLKYDLASITDSISAPYDATKFFSTLIKSCINGNWVDIENEYFKVLKLVIEKYKEDVNMNQFYGNKLTNLNAELNFLKSKLIEYLLEIEQMNKSDEVVIDEIRKYLFGQIALSDFSKDKEDLHHYKGLEQVQLLNFNYTSTAKRYLNEKENRYTTVNDIHGTLVKPESVVFGFGDEMDELYTDMEQLNDNEFFTHIKSFKYFQNNNYWNLLKFIETYKFQVSIMGHSCGLSDRTMLNSIFEHENCTSIRLFYHKRADGTNNFTELTHEISRHFTDKAAMRSKIVPFENSEPLPNLKPQ
ncbi:MAG: hypothetical protein ACI8ZM_002680 [Crocinitomix sp.]|jgi:hypothetical protein